MEANAVMQETFHSYQKKKDLKDSGNLNIFKEMIQKWLWSSFFLLDILYLFFSSKICKAKSWIPWPVFKKVLCELTSAK